VIAVVDSGGANLASVLYALARIGERAELVTTRSAIERADRVVLPGVGAAARAMQTLGANGIGACIAQLGKPVLGICLGMQLLYEASDEGDVRCLGLVPGRVTRLPARPGLSIPHMGWNRVERDPRSQLLTDVGDDAYFYFVHSYAAPGDDDFVRGRTTHGTSFASVIERPPFFGVQFHPERSGAAGAQLLRTFARLQ
jgi:glutamine amidotransferase